MSEVTLQLFCSNLNLNTLTFYTCYRVRKQIFHTFTAYSNNWKHFLREVSFIKHTMFEEINKSFESERVSVKKLSLWKWSNPSPPVWSSLWVAGQACPVRVKRKIFDNKLKIIEMSWTIWACCSRCGHLAAQSAVNFIFEQTLPMQINCGAGSYVIKCCKVSLVYFMIFSITLQHTS